MLMLDDLYTTYNLVIYWYPLQQYTYMLHLGRRCIKPFFSSKKWATFSFLGLESFIYFFTFQYEYNHWKVGFMIGSRRSHHHQLSFEFSLFFCFIWIPVLLLLVSSMSFCGRIRPLFSFLFSFVFHFVAIAHTFSVVQSFDNICKQSVWHNVVYKYCKTHSIQLHPFPFQVNRCCDTLSVCVYRTYVCDCG